MGINAQKGPILEKNTFDNLVGNIRFGVCEMQGWRNSMEDSSIAFPYFDHGNSIFGVMDGHGGKCSSSYPFIGKIISKFVSQNYLNILINLPSYQKGHYEQALIESFLLFDEILQVDAVDSFIYNSLHSSNNHTSSNTITTTFIKQKRMLQYDSNVFDFNTTIQTPMHIPTEEIVQTYKDSRNEDEVYIKTDEGIRFTEGEEEDDKGNSGQMRRMLSHNDDEDNDGDNDYIIKGKIADRMGTTVNIVFMTSNYIYIANAGDSLSVMYKNGKAIKLNQEHKITIRSEYDRILKSGGRIINHRIEGRLNLTRSIGDLGFKKAPDLKNYEQSVTSHPEITKIKYTSDIEFIVMGCDGLWDCVKPQEFCEMLSKKIQREKEMSLSGIIGNVFDQIISKSNTGKYNNK